MPDRDRCGHPARRHAVAVRPGAWPCGAGHLYAVPAARALSREARIGVDRRYFTEDYGGEPDLVAVASRARGDGSLGATIVDTTDTGDPFAYFDAEFTVLLFEFKVDIAAYLSTLGHTSMRTLADLIAVQSGALSGEMAYFGQELFEIAESTSGDLTDPAYLAARRSACRGPAPRASTRPRRDDLDAIVAPTYCFAFARPPSQGTRLSLPIGLTPEGKPAGLWMYSGFLQEPALLALAYDLEQELGPREVPHFLGRGPRAVPRCRHLRGPSSPSRGRAPTSPSSARRWSKHARCHQRSGSHGRARLTARTATGVAAREGGDASPGRGSASARWPDPRRRVDPAVAPDLGAAEVAARWRRSGREPRRASTGPRATRPRSRPATPRPH